jgi:hypothetical protein
VAHPFWPTLMALADSAAARQQAFGRSPLLDAASLRSGTPVMGNVERLRRALTANRPVKLAAIGASNTVRGGCQGWQRAKCAHPKYTVRLYIEPGSTHPLRCSDGPALTFGRQNISDDGTRRGWLLQAFDGLSRVWPHAQHRLVNSALMATGPTGFEGCLNTFISLDADVALLGFADICSRRTSLPLYNSTFGLALESIVRELAGRPDPPSIVFFNVHKFVAWDCTLVGGLCAYWMSCEAQIQELAQFYAASVVSVPVAA